MAIVKLPDGNEQYDLSLLTLTPRTTIRQQMDLFVIYCWAALYQNHLLPDDGEPKPTWTPAGNNS